MNVKKNVEVIEERRWSGHVKRMTAEMIPSSMMLEWTAEGKRKEGKPKEQWMDGVRRSVT